jgi:hypothetical protein
MNSLPYTIDRVLSERDAHALVRRAEAAGFDEAPITVGPNRFQMRPDIRNNTRVMFDDEQLAARLFERLRARLPERIGEWRLHG